MSYTTPPNPAAPLSPFVPSPQNPNFPPKTPYNKQNRASLVGGVDLDEDPQYLEDWGVRGLAADDCGVDDRVSV